MADWLVLQNSSPLQLARFHPFTTEKLKIPCNASMNAAVLWTGNQFSSENWSAVLLVRCSLCTSMCAVIFVNLSDVLGVLRPTIQNLRQT